MAGVGMKDVASDAPAVSPPAYHPSKFYLTRRYKGKLYEPVKFKKSLLAPKRCVLVLHIPATNPREESVA